MFLALIDTTNNRSNLMNIPGISNVSVPFSGKVWNQIKELDKPGGFINKHANKAFVATGTIGVATTGLVTSLGGNVPTWALLGNIVALAYGTALTILKRGRQQISEPVAPIPQLERPDNKVD
jgi:hypothetical protein